LKAIDGTAAVALYEIPDLGDDDLVIDFIDSASLEQIEDGIRKIQDTSDLLALVQGVAIVKIEREGLWMQAGFNNLKNYRIAQNERLGMPRQTVSRRRQVGEGYLDNRKLLGKFSLHGHVEKLRLLNDAVRMFGKKEAVALFKSSTLREFIEAVRPREIEGELTEVSFKLDKDGVWIDGNPTLLWPSNYPEPERKWLGSVVEKAFKARAGGNLAHVVSVYDAGEARAVDLFLKRHRESK